MSGRADISGVSVAVCRHGSLFLRLHRQDQTILAEIQLPDETAAALCALITTVLAEPPALRHMPEARA